MTGWITEMPNKSDSYNAGLAWTAIRELQQEVDVLRAQTAPEEYCAQEWTQ